jgi:aminotransferase
LLVLDDEIYADLTYGKAPFSIASSFPNMKERTHLYFGLFESLRNDRLAFRLCLRARRHLSRLKRSMASALLAAPTISQFAAVEALEHEEEETSKMREAYNARRLFLVKP